MALGQGLVALALQPAARGDKRVIEGAVVAVPHGVRHGPDLAEIGAAIGDVSQRPGAEVIVEFVLEQHGRYPF